MAGHVYGGCGGGGVGIALPAEEGAEGEVLHHWEFGEDFGNVHFQHALFFLERVVSARVFVPLLSGGGKCKIGEEAVGNTKSLTLHIFAHPFSTPEISNNIGLCSQNGPFFTSNMNPTAPKYMFLPLSRSTTVGRVMSAGEGAPGREPSVGMILVGGLVVVVVVVAVEKEMGGPSWAEPKM